MPKCQCYECFLCKKKPRQLNFSWWILQAELLGCVCLREGSSLWFLCARPPFQFVQFRRWSNRGGGPGKNHQAKVRNLGVWVLGVARLWAAPVWMLRWVGLSLFLFVCLCVLLICWVTLLQSSPFTLSLTLYMVSIVRIAEQYLH